MPKMRIDKLLTDSGLADSRAKAQAIIMSGVVLVDEKRVEKPSEKFEPGATIRLKGASLADRYVSRGGIKLEAALQYFNIDPNGWNCIDIGSSTGGFTDCLLQHRAARVTAIDSGTNQLDWRLRTDERVEIRENTNARYLKPSDFSTAFDLAVIDVSFISVKMILPAVVTLLEPAGKLIVLMKPQFEVGRGEVGKGGIVRDAEKHQSVIGKLNEFAKSLKLDVVGVIESPITGAEGNKEFLAYYAK
jgi:23S rRNA (cytidine1920-2'-O)/16S rRNA (cytidine1409-2'-O)-methyltransferase